MKGDGYFYLKMELLEIVYLGYPRYKFLFLMTAFQQLDAVSHQTKGDVLCSAAAPADNPRKPGSISYPNLSLLQHVTKLQILPQEELVLRCLPQPSNTFAFLTASNEFIFN